MEKQRVVIYSSIQSERLKYVLETIFSERLQIPFLLTSDKYPILDSDIVIEYNFNRTAEYEFIQAHSIIEDIQIQADEHPQLVGEGEGLKLYPDQNSLLGMDIFSAVFYCLSHYDAYLQKDLDVHQRIQYQNWYPRTSGLDRMPYVEIWIQQLSEYIESQGLKCYTPEFQQDISFDIDHIYLMDQRPFMKHIRASLGDIFRLKFFQLFQRWLIILGVTEDPAEKFFDMLDYKSTNKFSFFILMKEGKNNSLNPLNELKKLLIRKIKNHGSIALHPSYDSSIKKDLILKEKKQLEEIILEEVKTSRFHFLRFQFPTSFYHLSQAGIEVDKSIGYYDQPGFPSCTTLPYRFFDPIKNKIVPITISPFVWMDSMNKYYRTIDEKEEKNELLALKSIVKKYNGQFNVVFHNDSMIYRRYRLLFKSLLYN